MILDSDASHANTINPSAKDNAASICIFFRMNGFYFNQLLYSKS